MTSYPALRELAEKATSGPWRADIGTMPEDVGGGTYVRSYVDPKGQTIRLTGFAIASGNAGLDEPRATAEFVAAANPAAILDILDKYDAALAEIDRLKEALKPFADAAKEIPDGNPGDNRVHYSPAPLTVADFRRASQALRSTP